MPNYNKTILVGHLTRDPELRYTQSGLAVADFGLAVNRYYNKDGQKQEEVSFFDVVVYGDRAETIHQYTEKGSPLMVDGYLKQDRWEKDGQHRSKVRVVVESFQFMGGRREQKADEQPDEPVIPF